MSLSRVLQYLHPDADLSQGIVVVSTKGSEDLRVWDDSLGPRPTQAEIDAAELPAAKHSAKQAIKAEANHRILATMPDWKQRNLTARSVEIVSAIVDGTATQADHDELAVLKAQKADVDAVRTASDAAEAEVDALTTVADVEAYDVRGW